MNIKTSKYITVSDQSHHAQKKFAYYLTMLLLLLIACAQVVNAQLPVPEGRRLRDIVTDKYPDGKLLIGATTGSWGLNRSIGKVMDREFNYVTPENDFKHRVIRSNPSSWDWSKADAWLQHIQDNQQVLRIHGPIAPQCSNWAKEDHRTADELSEELDTFLTALCQRYNGVEGIKYMDVVNEIVLDNGKWHHPKPGTDQWENPWLTIGQDNDPNQTPLYVKQAFAIANEHAPDLKQIINNHCHPGTKGMEKVKETILYLRDRGYRVDGMGWQAHVDVGWDTEKNLQHLRDVIDWCNQYQLEFHITEFSAWIKNKYTQSFDDQARTYKNILDVLLQKLDTLPIGWNTWHITDAEGWQNEYLPSVFDENYTPKSAYYAVQLALESVGDYTKSHDIQFQVKHSETGQMIDSFTCKFNNVTQEATNGIAMYSAINTNQYTVQIEKPHYNTLIKKYINIYSDTTILLYLEPANYSVTFNTIDEISGKSIISAQLTIDTLIESTGPDGKAYFNLRPDKYGITIEKTGYKTTQSEYYINSDTTIVIHMEGTHADIKFNIQKNDSQPINDAIIVLNGDTVLTNSLGIRSYEFLPVKNNYQFHVEKEGFKTQTGSIHLIADTTVVLQLESTLANVAFEIHTENYIINENTLFVFNNDTTALNLNGLANFYKLPVNESYTYFLLNDASVLMSGTLDLKMDTTVQLTYVATIAEIISRELPVKLFPNPSKHYVQINAKSDIEEFTVHDLSGKLVKHAQVYSEYYLMDVSKMIKGQYCIRVKLANSNDYLSQIFIVQ